VPVPLARAGQYTGTVVLAATLVAGCGRGPTTSVVSPDLPEGGVGDASGPPPRSGLLTATPAEATATALPVATALPTPPGPLRLAEGFAAGVFAEDVPGVRMMAVAPNGDVLASAPSADRIVVLPDRNGDGVADRVVVYAQNEPLNEPHGLAIRGDWLYVANTDSVLRYAYTPGDLAARGAPETVVPSLPGGEQHWTRSLLFSADERMLVSVGSSCDVCVEDNPFRAAVLRFDADGANGAVLARGLRNAVGLAVEPETEAVWVTENGRDLLGDDLPPDELNVLRAGADYGWPYCYGQRVPDASMGASAERCAATDPPAVEIPAHSAPLGIWFYTGAMFPADYRHDAFVALHGSWNRSVPTGYKVVRIPFAGGAPSGAAEDFVWGWLLADTSRWGRPVGIAEAPDGALLVSDDFAGRVYRIVYAPVVPTPTPWH
jgi:glucose/arabinose dehydrogenase